MPLFIDNEINPTLLSHAFRFYARVLSYPYEELRHEFHHLLREIELNIQTQVDNTIASHILDIVNVYQGEEMRDLQGEYVRMFSHAEEELPLVSLRISDLQPGTDILELMDHMHESGLFLDSEGDLDSMINVLDYFSSLLSTFDEVHELDHFYALYIQSTLPQLAGKLYRETSINFYKECAKAFTSTIQLISNPNAG
ncbi:MAG: hypothetical protein GF313_11640 [Caldithrix sp.]|nr:hypothetical protein [Caldithrix sp.]